MVFCGAVRCVDDRVVHSSHPRFCWCVSIRSSRFVTQPRVRVVLTYRYARDGELISYGSKTAVELYTVRQSYCQREI